MGAAEIGLLSPTQSPASGGAACQITNGANSTSVGAILVVARPQGSLVLTGPAGQTLTADGYSSQYFGGTGSAEPVDSPDQLPPPFFSAGTWTLDVSGDPRVAAFQHTFQLPPELKWTNRGSLNTVSRTSDTAITWDPAGYSATDVATVTLERRRHDLCGLPRSGNHRQRDDSCVHCCSNSWPPRMAFCVCKFRVIHRTACVSTCR